LVSHVSQDRMQPTVSLNRLARVSAAVRTVSNDLLSWFNSHCRRAQGIIMKPRSCVPSSMAFWCSFSVHHLQANLLPRCQHTDNCTFLDPVGLTRAAAGAVIRCAECRTNLADVTDIGTSAPVLEADAKSRGRTQRSRSQVPYIHSWCYPALCTRERCWVARAEMC